AGFSVLGGGREVRDGVVAAGQRTAGHEAGAGGFEPGAGRGRLVGGVVGKSGGLWRVAVRERDEGLRAGGRGAGGGHAGGRRERGCVLGVGARGGEVAAGEVALHQERCPAADPAVVDVVGGEQLARALVLSARAEHGAEDRVRHVGRRG